MFTGYVNKQNERFAKTHNFRAAHEAPLRGFKLGRLLCAVGAWDVIELFSLRKAKVNVM